jgi:hypothetical protein
MRTRGDLYQGGITHVVTMVRDPLTRMRSLLAQRPMVMMDEYDYTSLDEYYKSVIKSNWGVDVYSQPFIPPFTAIDNVAILKFEMIEDAASQLFEWLEIKQRFPFPHHNKTQHPREVEPDWGKVKVMYDGRYAEHFGYEYNG